MKVVADTSPLNYLVLIDSVDVLHRIYGSIATPEEVLEELVHPGTPVKVRRWIRNHPHWLTIHPTRNLGDAALDLLDPGERAAISLAQELGPDVLLLIDESIGRIEASRRRIQNTGTLGVLRAAALLNLLDLPSALDRLLATNFRVSKRLVAELVLENRNRT